MSIPNLKKVKIIILMRINQEIAKRLREFADSKGGPSALAKLLNVKPQTLNSYLNGSMRPGNTLQEKLRALQCDITYLMFGETTEEINKKFEQSRLRQSDEAAKKRIAELEEEIKILRTFIAPNVLVLADEQIKKLKKKK